MVVEVVNIPVRLDIVAVVVPDIVPDRGEVGKSKRMKPAFNFHN